MSEPLLSPQEIAQYDQALADTERFLREMVTAYTNARAIDARNGVPEAVSVMALNSEIGDSFPAESLSSVLSVAVVWISAHANCLP